MRNTVEHVASIYTIFSIILEKNSKYCNSPKS
uniref:Uncharacterized protein n=1 Tax=Rhizophora mucronata TaxID=61149 RepID=A0A2P2QZ31_RHIMU